MGERMRRTMVTTIRVSPAVWAAMRRLAEVKALQAGGRASASGVVAELVLAELARLEKQGPAHA